MEPMGNYNDEQHRLKRDDKPRGFSLGSFMSFFLKPGLFGMVTVTLFYVLIPIFVDGIQQKVSIARAADKSIAKLNTDVTYLLALEFGKTNLWVYLLFGALLGIFIKYAYSDEKVG